MIFFLKRLGCSSDSITIFQHVICHWVFFVMVLPDSGISDIVPDNATFWDDGLPLFLDFWVLLRVQWFVNF